MLIISRYIVTTCKTDYYILVIFVVISKKEDLYIVERLYILIILDRKSTSLNNIKIF